MSYKQCRECKLSYMALSPDDYCGNCEPKDLREARLSKLHQSSTQESNYQRRRDMFERVLLQESKRVILNHEFDDPSTLSAYDYSKYKNIAEMYLKAADKFARGE